MAIPYPLGMGPPSPPLMDPMQVQVQQQQQQMQAQQQRAQEEAAVSQQQAQSVGAPQEPSGPLSPAPAPAGPPPGAPGGFRGFLQNIQQNPLFMGGLMGALAEGPDVTAAVGRGFQMAGQYQGQVGRQGLAREKLSQQQELRELQMEQLRTAAADKAAAKERYAKLTEKGGPLSSFTPEQQQLLSMLPPEQAAGILATQAFKPPKAPIKVGEDDFLYDQASGQWITPPTTKAGGPWTAEDMRKEYDYSKYTSGSVQAAEAASDPSLLTPKPGAVKFSDKMSATRHVTNQLAPFEEVASSTAQAFALLEGASGPEELGALIKYAKALDPGSVVREGEVTMQQQAAGIVARWENLLEALSRSGSALSLPHKQGIYDGLTKIMDINKTRYGYHREHYGTMLQENDIDKSFMPPEVRWTAGTRPASGTGPGKTVSFNQYRGPGIP